MCGIKYHACHKIRHFATSIKKIEKKNGDFWQQCAKRWTRLPVFFVK